LDAEEDLALQFFKLALAEEKRKRRQ